MSHQVWVAGELALVVAPSRPMYCLPAMTRAPCVVTVRCRRFCHVEAQSVPPYASGTGPADTEGTSEHLKDVVEVEETAQGAGGSDPVESSPIRQREASLIPDGKNSSSTLAESDENSLAAEAVGTPLERKAEAMDTSRAVNATASATRPQVSSKEGKENAGYVKTGEPPVKTKPKPRPTLRRMGAQRKRLPSSAT